MKPVSEGGPPGAARRELTYHQGEAVAASPCHHATTAPFPDGVPFPAPSEQAEQASFGMRPPLIHDSRQIGFCEWLLDLIGHRVSKGTAHATQ